MTVKTLCRYPPGFGVRPAECRSNLILSPDFILERYSWIKHWEIACLVMKPCVSPLRSEVRPPQCDRQFLHTFMLVGRHWGEKWQGQWKNKGGGWGSGFLQPGKCGLEHEIRATGWLLPHWVLLSCSADLDICGCNEYLAAIVASSLSCSIFNWTQHKVDWLFSCSTTWWNSMLVQKGLYCVLPRFHDLLSVQDAVEINHRPEDLSQL